MTLATLIQTQAAHHGSLRDLAALLASADQRILSADDLGRINRYVGTGADLHGLLPVVLPLAHPVWYEATVTAQHGTVTTLGYLAAPAPDGLDVYYAGTDGRTILGPLGPARVTAAGMDRPPDASDAAWRELRAAAGIVLRALMMETR